MDFGSIDDGPPMAI
jgi:hypothetical protein